MLPERLNEVFQNPLVLMPELAGKKMKDLPVDKKQELAAAINDFLEEHRQEIFAHLHERAFKDSQSQFLAQCSQLQSGIEGSQSIWQRAMHLLDFQFHPERHLKANLNAIFVLDQISDPNTRQQVEKFLETIPEDHRTEQVLGDLIEQTKSYTDSKKLSAFFRALESFPANERANVIKLLPFIENNYDNTIVVLKTLVDLPETERKNVLETENSYYLERERGIVPKALSASDFKLKPLHRRQVLNVLCELRHYMTKEDRELIFKRVAPFLNTISNEEVPDALVKIHYRSPHQREEIINMIAEKSSPFFRYVPNRFFRCLSRVRRTHHR